MQIKNYLFLISFFIGSLQAEEMRAFIKNKTTVENTLQNLNAQYKGNYSFTDHIYFPTTNTQASYARIRVYTKSEWKHKAVVLTIKDDKQNIIFKDEYNTLEEAQENMPQEFKYMFKFFREGWEYKLNDCALFLEEIRNFPLSLEIVAPTKQKIIDLFKKFNATHILENSIPITYAQLACAAARYKK